MNDYLQNQKKQFNKFTIGKELRKHKQLYKKDEKATIVQNDQKAIEYIQDLQNQGLVTKKVTIGEFYTKNGLPYTGLMATEKILTNEIFIKIPVDSLLTTKKCHQSDIQQIFEENPLFFHQENEQELKLLEDDELIKQAHEIKREYEQDYSDLVEILQKYPKQFSEESYNQENARWIYTHLISRCFGNYFQYVTMCPFAEYLNHECVDVYYDFQYNEGNPKKSEESEYPEPQEKTEDEILSITTSEGTYNSEQLEWDEEFEYQIQFNQKSTIQQVDGINEVFKNELRQMKKNIHSWIFNNLDLGDNFSIFFAAVMYEKCDNVEREFISGQIQYFQAKQELQNISFQGTKYKQELTNYYRRDLKRKKVYTVTQLQKRTPMKEELKNQFKQKKEFKYDKNNKYFDDKEFQNNDQFDYFVMKCGARDQFEKGSQVYFCYGRAKFLANEKNEINFDHYFYITDTNLEKICLEEMKKILDQYWQNNFSCSLEQNEQKLFDKNISYHEYFAPQISKEQQKNLKDKNQKQKGYPLTRKDQQQIQEINFMKLPGTDSEIGIWRRPSKGNIRYLKEDAKLTYLITCQSEKEDPKILQKSCSESQIKWMHICLNGANMALLSDKKTKQLITENLINLISIEKILIHCAAGIHRTGTITYSLLRFLGSSQEEALKQIQQLREVTSKQVGENRIEFAEEFIVQPYLNQQISNQSEQILQTKKETQNFFEVNTQKNAQQLQITEDQKQQDIEINQQSIQNKIQ
ncbi:hypothetical protein PPERSA_12513 [Pseudocohnilembus persalinus]|uniref:Tyrosine specific protein phosphatases domain-containing protein n=1 Tax=Pseudocohnilembus persalinus TaxID=266149 RepID=A0A0V0QPB1_PSEPJ|nr:hypothetical protein PPERSA_12513 [Pseudocohnilembus persalinus]|eukprot:KRX04066.1 hypothetical protein PPERSA_12513 [Pseudocohnilembus persalinus]